VWFKFNGRISRNYHVGKGILQGSPLSPTLVVAYIANIMEPRIRYSPSVRTMVSSYVDDTTILVAAFQRSLFAYSILQERVCWGLL